MTQLISAFVASLVLLVSNLLTWANFDAIGATFESRTSRDPERITDLFAQNQILKEKLNQATAGIQELQAAIETMASNLPDTATLILRIEELESDMGEIVIPDVSGITSDLGDLAQRVTVLETPPVV